MIYSSKGDSFGSPFFAYMVTNFASFWIDCSRHRGGRLYSNPSPPYTNKKPSQGVVTVFFLFPSLKSAIIKDEIARGGGVVLKKGHF